MENRTIFEDLDNFLENLTDAETIDCPSLEGEVLGEFRNLLNYDVVISILINKILKEIPAIGDLRSKYLENLCSYIIKRRFRVEDLPFDNPVIFPQSWMSNFAKIKNRFLDNEEKLAEINLDFQIIRNDVTKQKITIIENLIGQIKNLNHNSENSTALENELSASNHRLVLLVKLGIFEMLYNKYRKNDQLNLNEFSTLLATILNIPEKSFIGFRGEVGKLMNDQTKSKVLTESAIKKVNSYLAELGINS
jgi:hypothetical protein